MWYVYILKSTKNKRFYIGVTERLEIRIVEHNQGKAKSTKPYRPWNIIYKEEFNNKSEAYKREYWLKHPKGYNDKLNIIKQHSLD